MVDSFLPGTALERLIASRFGTVDSVLLPAPLKPTTTVLFQEAWEYILSFRRINIYMHAGPDGDSLASCKAIRDVLRHYSGKSIDAEVIMLDPIAGKLSSPEFTHDILRHFRPADLHIYPDTSCLNLVTRYESPSVVLDHHGLRTDFGDMQSVRIHPSYAGVLYHEWQDMGIFSENTLATGSTFPLDIAKLLLIGAHSDTAGGLLGTLEQRVIAKRDIVELDAICGNCITSYEKTFMGLTDEQASWLDLVVSQIHVADGVASVFVPLKKTLGLSHSDIRMRLQEIPYSKLPGSEFPGFEFPNHFIWGYYAPLDKKADAGLIHRYGPGYQPRYSIRSTTFSTIDFMTHHGYNGSGHHGASNFTTGENPEEVIRNFRNYVKIDNARLHGTS